MMARFDQQHPHEPEGWGKQGSSISVGIAFHGEASQMPGYADNRNCSY
jgi:hypothetical protein